VVSRARNLILRDFLDSPCTELLFIDADINFEPEAIFRLMAFGGEKSGILAAPPRIRDTHLRYIVDLDEEDGHVTTDAMGLVRGLRVATAFMWVDRPVFDDLVANHPEWTYYDQRADRNLSAVFDFKVTPEGYVGEDFLFCDRAREAGYEVWIDPTIQLGHMGVQEYVGCFGTDVLDPMLAPVKELEEV
jgi:GT2 family glycosyltransferase